MAVNYNPPIVTKNLIFNVDVTNPRSYPGTGTTWYDLSGNNNHGTLNNMTSANVVRTYGGKAFNFTSTAYVKMTDVVRFNYGFTISAWFSYATMGGWEFSQAIECAYDVAGVNYLWFFGNRGFSGPKFEFCYGRPGLSVAYGRWVSIPTTAVSLNAMDNWVVTISTEGGEQFYKNGTLQVSTTNTGTPPYQYVDTGFCIGGRMGNNPAWTGALDGIMIYDRALTQQEVLQNFNATRGRFGV